MASNDFGLTPESVRARHFPNADAWVESSRPSESAVQELIDECGAMMAGKLALENIDASAITTDSDAYKFCRKVLRMQVAAELARDMLGVDPAISKAWAAVVDRFYKDLDEGGVSALGDGATASGNSPADGPHTHLSVYSLPVDVAEDMSDPTDGKLRMDDET